MPPHYVWLVIAIVTETLGTTALQASQQFTRFWPSVAVVCFYSASFFFMSMALKVMPVGIVYAVWSGLGIVLIACIGWVLFGQKLDLAAILGLGMIIGGIVVIQIFSTTTHH